MPSSGNVDPSTSPENDWIDTLKPGDEIVCVESFAPYKSKPLRKVPVGKICTVVEAYAIGVDVAPIPELRRPEVPLSNSGGIDVFSIDEIEKYFDLHRRADAVATDPSKAEGLHRKMDPTHVSMQAVSQGSAAAASPDNEEGLRYNEGKTEWPDTSPTEKASDQPHPQAALRYNEGKVAWHNIPFFLLEGVMRVGTYGAKKYAAFNYLKGMSLNKVLDSAKRHLAAFESPFEDDNDAESGESHLDHAAWNLLFASYIMKYKSKFDDRYKDANS